MTRADPAVVASVRQRLLNRARREGEDYNALLTRYVLERFLYRLSCSGHRDRFVVKGAMLFVLWDGDLHRMTRDLDLLGYGASDPEAVASAVREILLAAVPDDGITFDAASVRAAAIREEQTYEGVRVGAVAHLGSARVRLQVDVGFGDAVTPGPVEATFPVLLAGQPAPVLRAYPAETVVAEKVEAMVTLGMLNSRMKDFYDVWHLAAHTRFDGALLARAVEATLTRRGTRVPGQVPLALTDAFALDAAKQAQWRAFVTRGQVDASVRLPEVVAVLQTFLLPLLGSIGSGHAFNAFWEPGGPWT